MAVDSGPPVSESTMLAASASRSGAPRPLSTVIRGWNFTRSSSPGIFRTSSSNLTAVGIGRVWSDL
jgi:hypothetical protein